VITRVKLAIKEKRQEKGEEKKDAWKGVESEIALRKRRGGKEQRRRGVGDRNKTVYFVFFWNYCFMFKEKYNQESESP
jgi:hypothetical protein